jgi:hypothetical protein
MFHWTLFIINNQTHCCNLSHNVFIPCPLLLVLHLILLLLSWKQIYLMRLGRQVPLKLAVMAHQGKTCRSMHTCDYVKACLYLIFMVSLPAFWNPFFYRIHFIYYHTSLILLTIKEKKIVQLLQFFIVSLSHGFDIFFKLKRKKG